MHAGHREQFNELCAFYVWNNIYYYTYDICELRM